MAKVDAVFTGSIPALYDTYLGPLIFKPYADDLSARLIGLTTGHVLETAAGTGVVTRTLNTTLPVGVRITATDLNQPMLNHAASKLISSRVSWQKADAQALPFADASFDTVVCQFGVMFFPDKRKAYQEALRVLKPGGRFIFNAWDKIEHNDFAAVVTAALAEFFPADPPRFMARAPHGYHAPGEIRSDLLAAGFNTIALETITRQSVAASCHDPAIGYCQGTPLRNEIEARDANGLAAATELAAKRLSEKFGAGPVTGKIQAHVVTASK